MVFHFTHNSLMLAVGELHDSARFSQFVQPLADGKDFIYMWWLFGFGLIASGVLLLRFARLTRPNRQQVTTPMDAMIHTLPTPASAAGLSCGG
jgi:hypothetical protein